MSKNLLIIDVDAFLGIRSPLQPPCCIRSHCDKGESFRGDDGRCLLRKWCQSAFYQEESIRAYRSALNFTVKNCYAAVNPVLDKLQEINWEVSFWTTRPRTQTFHIIKVLKEAGIWERAQLLSGTTLLLNNNEVSPDGKFSPATEKLKLFEKVYGRVLQDDTNRIVAIESDPLEASILRAYLGERVSVHMAPRVWMNLLISARETIGDVLILKGEEESGMVLQEQVS